MTADLYIRYTAVIFTIIALILLVQLFFSLYRIIFRNNGQSNITANNSTYQKIMEDLDKIVQRKCYTAYRRALQPYVNKALKNKPLINDKVVNEISIQITKELFEELSNEYLQKLYAIYKEEKVEDIILELVYNTVTEMAMNINKNSINKMNFINRIGTIQKNDFDSE
jgi:hypothetical protein